VFAKRAALAREKNDLWDQIERMLTNLGQTRPPVDLELIAKHRKIHEILRVPREVGDPEGILLPVEDGFLVRVASGLYDTRYRSTLAHEIAHTFFFDDSTPTPRKRAEWFTHAWSEEGAASEVARQILVPRSMLRPLAASWNNSQSQFTFGTILYLAETFRVSPEIIIRRLQDENLCNAVFIFFERDKFNNLVPLRPMFSVGSLRVRGICARLVGDQSLSRAMDRFMEDPSASSEESFVEFKNKKLAVTFARVNMKPFRILALATPLRT
jgi:hypothetical protein